MGATTREIRSPYSGEVIEAVPLAGPDEVEATLERAVEGARRMAALAAHRRVEILRRAANLLEERAEELARLVSLEMGKPLGEARPEAVRSAELLRLAAFEGAQARGETLPMDAHPGGEGKLGFTVRVPCGLVVAITPFNYPLLLVAHKVGPALAAGNAVILKPASQTPLSARAFTDILHEAGVPPAGLQLVVGSGSEVGAALCADERVRKISFTGSSQVGEAITRVAGVKRLSLELGANCPMIVLPDADLEAVADATASAGYVNAGQVCISLQRVLVHRDVYGDYLEAVRDRLADLVPDDPLAEGTRLGPMVSPGEAERVDRWIEEAVAGGARLVVGGKREGALFPPAMVADVGPEMRIFADELFGPAVAVTPVEDVEEAIALANRSRYGLAAGIFTADVGAALRFAREAEVGNVHINWTPLWRADFMPYGGLKGSGLGKEGPRYAVEEMTELKTVVVHGLESG